VEGYVDSEHGRNRDAVKMQPLRKFPGKYGFSMDTMNEFMHQTSLAIALENKSPYILCSTCLEASPHTREHLQAVRNFSKGSDQEVMEPARELDTWEDHLVR